MPSSVIDAIQYNETSSLLTITFVSGKVYQYSKVPRRIYNALKAAGSKGRYFNRFIKGKYPFRQK